MCVPCGSREVWLTCCSQMMPQPHLFTHHYPTCSTANLQSPRFVTCTDSNVDLVMNRLCSVYILYRCSCIRRLPCVMFVFIILLLLINSLVSVAYICRPLTSNRHHLSYDDCLENKGRLQDCSCSIGSYHCIQCYAHIL